jgi:hypothetical protein
MTCSLVMFGTFFLVMVWNFFLVHYLWRNVRYVGWLLVLGFSSIIIMSDKVKVLGVAFVPMVG